MATTSSRTRLRTRIAQRTALLVPGAFNALSARVIADIGFEAVYISGAGVTNMSYALPDLGFITPQDLVEQTTRIRAAVALPIIVDCDTGFGNALNVRHTVRLLESAGADALQLEDQSFPKRCGHFSGKAVIPAQEMATKIRAAAEARRDPDLQLIARTDAAAVEGFDAAIERAHRYAEAGADILFVEAVTEMDQIRRLPGLLPRPALINLVLGGRTPVPDHAELARLGYGMVLYANTALQGAVLGMQRALGRLHEQGRLDEDPNLVAPFAERQRLVDKPRHDALEQRYKD